MNNVEHTVGEGSPSSMRFTVLEKSFVWVVSAYGAVAALVLLMLPRFYMPAEDAVILFQFSRNLAQHGAITYIPNGPHAEGATDFGWMALIALGIKMGVAPYWLVAVINFGCILLLGALLVQISGHKLRLLPLLFVSGIFGMLPQFSAAGSGFSTLPFACLLTLLALRFLREDDVGTPLVGLVLCLFRPDGVVFAIPILFAGLILYPGKSRRLALQAGLFILPGIAYFLWRWHYFGEMLPLPFLVKGDAVRVAHVLVADSFREGIGLCMLALAVLWPTLYGRMADKKNRAVLLCLVVLPNLFYFSMRLDQDVGRRFFIYLPIGTAVLVAMNWSGVMHRLSLVLRSGVTVWLVLVFHPAFAEAHGSWAFQLTNRRDIGLGLAALPQGTLLTTEAGVVPYYSGWVSYDAWGLNTEQFATRLLRPEDVASLKPDLVMLHTGDQPEECVPESGWATPYATRTWHNMTRNLIAGADAGHYELWLAPRGNATDRARHHLAAWEGDEDCWLIRRDSAQRAGVEAVLALHQGLPAEEYEKHIRLTGPRSGDLPYSPAGRRGIATRAASLWHALDRGLRSTR